MQNRKNIIIVVAIVLTILIGVLVTIKISGTFSKQKTKLENNKIKITINSWSSLSGSSNNDQKTDSTIIEEKIELNKKILLGGIYDLEIEIVKINSDNIRIKTNKPMSENEKGINLNPKETEFSVKKGKTTKLETPTMDAGNIYYIDIIN